ncbi:MAG: fatty acid desaturase [Pseudomonadota bacterium]
MFRRYQIRKRRGKPYAFQMREKADPIVEWPTFCLFVACYALWLATLFWVTSVPLAIALSAVLIAFQASLQHEAIHGHPFRAAWANTALAWPPLTLFVPYLRFRDTHIDHHSNCDLTDPFDDPETNYCSAEFWQNRTVLCRAILSFNNTLAGRLLIGPAIGTVFFLITEMQNPKALRGWLWHIPAATAVLAVVMISPLPVWAYLIACYAAMGLLRIRTFAEHQAHVLARGRSVIIEDRGPLALLFLNNNLHAVHHAHPKVPWYRLPALYCRQKTRFQRMNNGYVFPTYAEVFRRYFFRRKDPVVHPLKG